MIYPSAVPFVRVLDAYAIARSRADAHPGPDPKTNPRGRTDSMRLYDDCLHYCLPGVPDLFNGRLQRMIEERASIAEARRAGSAGALAEGSAEAVEGAPGTLLARWNFEFGGAPFVQGSVPHLALRLQPGKPTTPLDCPLTPPGVP
jgi:hypothetical protein